MVLSIGVLHGSYRDGCRVKSVSAVLALSFCYRYAIGMPNILIRNLPDDVVASLKARASKNHRSLQEELEHILTDIARGKPKKSLPPVKLHLSDVEVSGNFRRKDIYGDDGR